MTPGDIEDLLLQYEADVAVWTRAPDKYNYAEVVASRKKVSDLLQRPQEATVARLHPSTSKLSRVSEAAERLVAEVKASGQGQLMASVDGFIVHVVEPFTNSEHSQDSERPHEPAPVEASGSHFADDEGIVCVLASHLAKSDGHDDPNHLIWEGGPIPEPWGEVWCRYEEPAKEILRLVDGCLTPKGCTPVEPLQHLPISTAKEMTMTTDAAIEQEIQDKGLTAPRITPAHIDAVCHKPAQFHVFPGTMLTVCCLELANGFTVTGESACASPENFNQEIGEKIAYANAKQKVWALEGYLLKQKLFNQGQA